MLLRVMQVAEQFVLLLKSRNLNFDQQMMWSCSLIRIYMICHISVQLLNFFLLLLRKDGRAALYFVLINQLLVRGGKGHLLCSTFYSLLVFFITTLHQSVST